jgi:hypothetical protein
MQGMSEETVEETAAEAAQRPPETARVDGRAATQFKPGNPGPSHNRKGQGRGLRKPPKLLADMRRVYAQDESKDRTPGQKRCRAWMDTDPAGFLSRLADLEKTHAPVAQKAVNTAVKEKPPAEPEEDLNSENVETLIGKLLGDFKQQEREERVRDGRCVTCNRPVPPEFPDDPQ